MRSFRRTQSTNLPATLRCQSRLERSSRPFRKPEDDRGLSFNVSDICIFLERPPAMSASDWTVRKPRRLLNRAVGRNPWRRGAPQNPLPAVATHPELRGPPVPERPPQRQEGLGVGPRHTLGHQDPLPACVRTISWRDHGLTLGQPRQTPSHHDSPSRPDIWTVRLTMSTLDWTNTVCQTQLPNRNLKEARHPSLA